MFNFHINQIANRMFDEWAFFHDATTFINSTGAERRIACFQIPYPYDPVIEQQIDEIYDHVDHVLVIGSELHGRTVDFVTRFDRAKIKYFLCGFLNVRMVHSAVYKFLDWFTTTIYFYKHVKPSILYQLKPYEVKPLMFDALLGRKKPHRDRAYEFMQEHNLLKHGLVTYIDDYRVNFDSTDTDKWIWESEGIEDFVYQTTNIQYTVDRVKYYGYQMSISQIVPIKAYNRTAVSLVCETNQENEYVFFTEKTVKPILARRMFITIGNRYHLAGLRRLGFRTFDSIIDESYDAIEGTVERHRAAMEQLAWLCQQDQADLLRRLQPIVDHNYDLLYRTDWYNLFRGDFGNFFFPAGSQQINLLSQS